MNIFDTLHPEGSLTDNLYPNIKKENIPSKSISTDKLDDNVLSLIGSLKPSGTDTSTNILSYTSNKGIYVATDNGHWYYWNAYADGGVYQSSEDIVQIKSDLEKVLESNILYNGNRTLSGTGAYIYEDIFTFETTDNEQICVSFESVEGNTAEYFAYLIYKNSSDTQIAQAGLNGLKNIKLSPVGATKAILRLYPAQGIKLPSGSATFKGISVIRGVAPVERIRDDIRYDRLEVVEKKVENVDIVNDNILFKTDSYTVYGNGAYVNETVKTITEGFKGTEKITASFGNVEGATASSPARIEYLKLDGTLLSRRVFTPNKSETYPIPYGCEIIKVILYPAQGTSLPTESATFKDIVVILGESEERKITDKIGYELLDSLEENSDTIDYGLVVPKYYHENYTDLNGTTHGDYIEYKAKRVNDILKGCASKGDAFIFVTDQHVENNQNHSNSLIKYLYRNCHIDKCINGGDTSLIGVSDDYMQSLRRAFKGNIYSATGNHEFFGGTKEDAVSMSFDMHNDNVHWGSAEHRYYYVDNKRAKIRYIFITAFYEGSDNQYQGWLTDEEQVNWFKNVATNVESGWGMVIITHMFYFIDYNDARTITYDSRTASIENAINNYNGNGEFICMLQGHVHMDRVTTLRNGTMPIIMTTCDKNIQTTLSVGDWSGSDMIDDRPTGTIKEQAFDVVIIDRKTRKITCVRVGCPARDGVDNAIGEYVEERVINY